MVGNMTKTGLISILAVLLGVFHFGYLKGKRSVNVAVSAEVVEVKDKEVDKHIETVTTKDRQGNVKIITITDSVARDHTNKQTATTTIIKQLPKINVSLLGGFDFQDKELVYGLSITKEVYGPLTVGVFGLSNKTAGISIGISLP